MMATAQRRLPRIDEVLGPHDPELVDKLTAVETLIESNTNLLAQLDQLKTQCVSSENLVHMTVRLDGQSNLVARSLDDLHRVRRKLLQSQGSDRVIAVA